MRFGFGFAIHYALIVCFIAYEKHVHQKYPFMLAYLGGLTLRFKTKEL